MHQPSSCRLPSGEIPSFLLISSCTGFSILLLVMFIQCKIKIKNKKQLCKAKSKSNSFHDKVFHNVHVRVEVQKLQYIAGFTKPPSSVLGSDRPDCIIQEVVYLKYIIAVCHRMTNDATPPSYVGLDGGE